MTSILNPKAYLFMLAVYPQFLKPQFGPSGSQALIMAIMISVTQLAVYGSLALAAGRSRDLLVANPRATALVGKSVGLVLIVVAALTAWQGWTSVAVGMRCAEILS